jgi:hypothetical protein
MLLVAAANAAYKLEKVSADLQKSQEWLFRIVINSVWLANRTNSTENSYQSDKKTQGGIDAEQQNCLSRSLGSVWIVS